MGLRGPKPRPPSERFWRKVQKTDSCWLWLGFRNRLGYGYFQAGTGPKNNIAVAPHRFAYLEAGGVIPAGYQLDHLCRNPSCVNPDHLEPVTNAENQRRRALTITHCPQGHEYNAANTYVRKVTGHRQCRRCAAEYAAVLRARAKAGQ